MEDTKLKYSQLEMARVIGEPVDPRKPYTDVVSAVSEIGYADPNEYVYYFDVLNETDTVYTTLASGVTSSNVSPDTAAEFTFVDVATPEYYVKISDLASSKESTLARKLKTIERTLNMYENKYIFSLASAAVSTSGFANTLASGQMRFNYAELITMVQQVVDYGDNYVLFAGSEIDTDIKLWDWNDNKYHSMVAAFGDLGIQKIRMGVGNVVEDSKAGARQLDANKAYLIATSTEVGKPFLFVRKNLNDIDLLGGAIKSNGEKPQRLIFVSPNPIVASGGTTRYLAVGVIGYEQIVAACINPYGVSRFIRS